VLHIVPSLNKEYYTEKGYKSQELIIG